MYYNNNYYYGGYNNLPRMNFSRVYPRVVVYNRNFAELPDTPEKKFEILKYAGVTGPASHALSERGWNEPPESLFKDQKGDAFQHVLKRQGEIQGRLDALQWMSPEFKRKLIDNPSQFVDPADVEYEKSLMRRFAKDPSLSSKEKRQRIARYRSDLYDIAAANAVREAGKDIRKH